MTRIEANRQGHVLAELTTLSFLIDRQIATLEEIEQRIQQGLASRSLFASKPCASVLVAKYGWHLPLYRQAKMLASQGIDLDRSCEPIDLACTGRRAKHCQL